MRTENASQAKADLCIWNWSTMHHEEWNVGVEWQLILFLSHAKRILFGFQHEPEYSRSLESTITKNPVMLWFRRFSQLEIQEQEPNHSKTDGTLNIIVYVRFLSTCHRRQAYEQYFFRSITSFDQSIFKK